MGFLSKLFLFHLTLFHFFYSTLFWLKVILSYSKSNLAQFKVTKILRICERSFVNFGPGMLYGLLCDHCWEYFADVHCGSLHDGRIRVCNGRTSSRVRSLPYTRLGQFTGQNFKHINFFLKKRFYLHTF